MRDANLKHILEDIERVAVAAEQLLHTTRSSGRTSGATRPPQQVAANGDEQGSIANTTREYMRRSPWRTLGIATGLGFLIGCMLTGEPRHRAPHE